MSRHPNYMRGTPKERFWAKVDKGDGAGCWLWTAKVQNKGYGVFAIRPPDGIGRYSKVLAHRFAYQLVVGPIPDGLTLDHLCRVPRCVRPDHLEPVTHRENIVRGMEVVKAARTHCRNGHPWTEENTRWRPDRPGSRECRTCAYEWGRTKRKPRTGVPA